MLRIVARVVKRLMSEFYPGQEGALLEFPETGGAQPVTYTVTQALPMSAGATDMSIAIQTPGFVVEVPAGGAWFLDCERTQKGADFGPTEATYYGWVASGPSRAIIVRTGIPYAGEAKDTIVYVSSSYAIKERPTPPTPEPPPTPIVDCSDAVTAAVRTRDDQWETALKEGEAWPTEDETATAGTEVRSTDPR